MALSSVSVVCSSLLLYRYRPPKILKFYDRKLRAGDLGLESVEIELADGTSMSHHIDPMCLMAEGGECTHATH